MQLVGVRTTWNQAVQWAICFEPLSFHLLHLCKQLDKITALVTLKDVAKLIMVGDHV